MARDGETSPLTVEDHLVAAATPHIRRYRPEPRAGYSLSDVLLLPREELGAVCQEAFRSAVHLLLEQAGARATLLLSFHPVLYHQLTREFVSPYQSASLASVLGAAGVELSFLVSVHDDVFDVYRRLLRPRRLFAPSITRPRGANGYNREPLRDILEQLLLLNWRGRELSEAKSLAAGTRARHYLFHQKGHRDSLWRAVGPSRSPSIYFSHPISQPRRDMLRIPTPGKCKDPDPVRGEGLRDACQAFSRELRVHVPTVEPTAIDELRIRARELDGKSEAVLRDRIMPPLDARWPLNDGPHLGGPLPDDSTPFLAAPPGAYDDFTPGEEPLSVHRAALAVLEDEIKRQINVRDHSLAEQCDLVVAFRPFCIPDSPEPSGGVKKEIDVVARKLALGKPVCKPALIVVHPLDDEMRRREKEFDRNWDTIAAKFFGGAAGYKLSSFRMRAREAFSKAGYRVDDESIRRSVKRIVSDLGLQCSPLQDESSMSAGEYGRAEEALEQFLAEVLERTSIARSFLHKAEEGATRGYVELVDDTKASASLLKRIRSVVESGVTIPRREGG